MCLENILRENILINVLRDTDRRLIYIEFICFVYKHQSLTRKRDERLIKFYT